MIAAVMLGGSSRATWAKKKKKKKQWRKEKLARVRMLSDVVNRDKRTFPQADRARATVAVTVVIILMAT
jgi:hypothetical protein